eukprot:GHRQ01025871.1.p1 GENE.GHRQ01025871.1~~GHRQ01025871.1.p1  ORF type:complete len:299 (+),score=147.53 GHRQ01025871.1:82-978(+)
MGKSERPEHTAPPDIFYNEDEARKYTTNTRMIAIQEKLTQRALELLALPPDGTPRLLLDIGCGSGLSGEALTDAGHAWLGLDISAAMLDVAVEREVEGDVLLGDMGQGVPLRQGCFDGAISISAVQWLCNADRSSHQPRKRLKAFFESLYRCLARGARAVLQVYPENSTQAEMMVAAAMKVGFSGGLVVDYPHSTRAKKFFLVLMVGPSSYVPQAKGTDGADEPMSEDEDVEMEDGGQVRVEGRQRKKHGKPKGSGKSGAQLKTKGWVLKKKAQMRGKGYTAIPVDTKYTARKRKKGF